MTESDGGQSERLITLDAMRGFAVMGILAMNIVAFAMPEMAYVSPRAYGGETTSDLAAWAFGFILLSCFGSDNSNGLLNSLLWVREAVWSSRRVPPGSETVGLH